MRLHRLRRRARVLAGRCGLWREELARLLAGHISIAGTKSAVKRAQLERLKLLGSHGQHGGRSDR